MNDTCDFLLAYNARRGPFNSSLDAGVAAFLVIVIGLMLLTTAAAVRARHAPQFHRVRPPIVSVLLCANCALSLIAYLTPGLTHHFPCGLELFLHVLVAGACWSVYAMRLLVFVNESEYTSSIVRSCERSRSVSTATSLPPARGRSELLEVLRDLNKLAGGFEELEIGQYVRFRRFYFRIFAWTMLPQTLFSGLVLLIGSKYRGGCTECPVESGFIAVVFVCMALSMAVSRGIFLRAACGPYVDAQGVLGEFKSMILLTLFWSSLGYGLEAADHNSVQFNRLFTWRFVLCMWPISIWVIAIVRPLLASHRHLRTRRQSLRSGIHRTSTVMDMKANFMDHVIAMPELNAKFMAFAAAQLKYDVNFLHDVILFKRRNGTDTPMTKHEMVMEIYHSYIADGAPQRLELEPVVRNSIINTVGNASSMAHKTVSQLQQIYDAAYEEVKKKVESTLWVDFINANPALFSDGAEDI